MAQYLAQELAKHEPPAQVNEADEGAQPQDGEPQEDAATEGPQHE